MPEAGPPKQLVATIERALSVLDLMAATDSEDLGVTEVAQKLDLSKAVVHRVLVTLVAHDYLQVDEKSRRYSLGPMALALGSAYLGRLDLRNLALPRLQGLSQRTGETATFSLRNGWTRTYVDQVTPDREIKMSVAIGKAYPLHAGSSSKSFLAFLPLEEQSRYIEESELAPLTDNTITGSGHRERSCNIDTAVKSPLACYRVNSPTIRAVLVYRPICRPRLLKSHSLILPAPTSRLQRLSSHRLAHPRCV